MSYGRFGPTHPASRKRPKFKQTLEVYCPAIHSVGMAEKLERGDKVVMHPSLLPRLEAWLSEGPLMFRVRNPMTDRRIHCGVLEFGGTREDVVYMPLWMMSNLGVVNGMSVTFYLCPKVVSATWLKVKALTAGFADATSTPKAQLELALRTFTVVTVGDIIPIQIGGRTFKLEVLDAKPETRAQAVCLIDTVCEVEFEAAPVAADMLEAGGAGAGAGAGAGTGFGGSAGSAPVSNGGSASRPTRVKLGCVATGAVAPDASEYFFLRLPAGCGVSLAVKAMGGAPSTTASGTDADVYVSTSSSTPSRTNFTWSNTSLDRNKTVTIPPSDPHLASDRPGGAMVYVVVNGYGTGGPVSYQLEPTLLTEAVGGAHGGSDSGGASVVAGPGDTASQDTAQCSNCGQMVPSRTVVMHKAFCARNNWKCPTCSQVLRIADKDRHAHCPDCDEVIPPDAQPKHWALRHKAVTCACGLSVAPDMMATHTEFECDLRPVACPHCTVSVPYKELKKHQDYCGARTQECDLCGAPVPVGRMGVHMAVKHGVNPSLGQLSSEDAVDAAANLLKSNAVATAATATETLDAGGPPPATRRDEVKARVMGSGRGRGRAAASQPPVLPPRLPASAVAPTGTRCPSCGSDFDDEEAMRVHRLTACAAAARDSNAGGHDPKMCGVCGLRFDGIDDLQVHMLTTCVGAVDAVAALDAASGPPPAEASPPSPRAPSVTEAAAATASPPPADDVEPPLECVMCGGTVPNYDALQRHLETDCPAARDEPPHSPLAQPLASDEEYAYSDSDMEFVEAFDDDSVGPAYAALVAPSSAPPPAGVPPAAASVSVGAGVGAGAPCSDAEFRAPGNGTAEVGDKDVVVVSSHTRLDQRAPVRSGHTCACGFVAEAADLLAVHAMTCSSSEDAIVAAFHNT